VYIPGNKEHGFVNMRDKLLSWTYVIAFDSFLEVKYMFS